MQLITELLHSRAVENRLHQPHVKAQFGLNPLGHRWKSSRRVVNGGGGVSVCGREVAQAAAAEAAAAVRTCQPTRLVLASSS